MKCSLWKPVSSWWRVGIELKGTNQRNGVKRKQRGLIGTQQRFLRAPNGQTLKVTESFPISTSDWFCGEDRWQVELYRSVLTPAYLERGTIQLGWRRAKTQKIWFPALSVTWNTIATARSFPLFMLLFPDLSSNSSYSVGFLYKIFPVE